MLAASIGDLIVTKLTFKYIGELSNIINPCNRELLKKSSCKRYCCWISKTSVQILVYKKKSQPLHLFKWLASFFCFTFPISPPPFLKPSVTKENAEMSWYLGYSCVNQPMECIGNECVSDEYIQWVIRWYRKKKKRKYDNKMSKLKWWYYKTFDIILQWVIVCMTFRENLPISWFVDRLVCDILTKGPSYLVKRERYPLVRNINKCLWLRQFWESSRDSSKEHENDIL